MDSKNLSYKAGVAKGQSEVYLYLSMFLHLYIFTLLENEKANQTMEAMKETAQAAKDKAYETAQAVKDKAYETAQAASNAAQAATDKTSQAAQAAKDNTSQAAQTAREKTSETADATKQKSQETGQAAREKAEIGKENTGGILNKTGEQVMNIAQGATDAVKHTFGFDTTGGK
ncbi:hypothetical protein JRO89_XS09G0131000 [Xanthoceras sorbifolium]|uniref:Uncharacterized protein n=1 Tax=Xanthoceras sorbifolium TaxID=99658 RepID=A0ABQ8HL61_9ROSI|nr:hypothetical protein JRO89_XS09G0131000 [Xanthoceras sorbifolium]